MPEPVDWQDDGSPGGTPYSPRFGDRYRSELGGLEQARDVFFKGCGLPQAWSGHRQWCILETGFGLGLNFLVTWQAWRDDPARPQMLHFMSTEAFPASPDDVLRAAAAHPSLQPLAAQLKDQFWGLLPGFHRLSFEDGRVLLTLCIGDAKTMLKQQHFTADSVYLDGFSPQKNPDIWDIHTMKAVARCCRRGTRIATWTIARSVRDALGQCGFAVHKTPGIPPKRDNLQGEYAPAWEPKAGFSPLGQPACRPPGTCIVIGAGLAGSAVAASLARRGWQVTVLDAGTEPAAGASGLPAGLAAPHVSPDDAPVSRLSRAGLRITIQQARQLLQAGQDWQPTGVLEHLADADKDGRLPLPASWHGDWTAAASDWSAPATPQQIEEARLPPATRALWHGKAAWIKPASLVRAWLQTPGIRWVGNSTVSSLVHADEQWHARGRQGEVHASADLVVMAAAFGNVALHADIAGGDADAPAAQPLAPLTLQALRGQLSWRLHLPGDQTVLPPFPVNGHGSVIPAVPVAQGLAWMAGSTFERDESRPLVKTEDDSENIAKARVLLPALSSLLPGGDSVHGLESWSGVRCATVTRLPLLGPFQMNGAGHAARAAHTLWISSGMGSRGLAQAALCAELLAARLHGEPLPIESKLAQALSP